MDENFEVICQKVINSIQMSRCEAEYDKVMNLIQMSRCEAERLFKCALRVPTGGTIIEIGTYKGGSAHLLRTACKDRKVNIFSVDNFSEIPQEEVISNLNKWGNGSISSITLIKGDSKEIGKIWDKKIDLLFIDGDHSENGVKGDFDVWFTHLKEDGIICFHDYNSRSSVTDGVNNCLKEWATNKKDSLLILKK